MEYLIDGPTKVITLTSGTVAVSVKDVWSRWVDWFLTGDNSKYLPAFEFVGGNDIDQSAGTTIPIYAFLMNGWKIKPQEANHTLSIQEGILLVDGGGDPFNNTSGTYTVRINYQQPVQAITVSTGGGGGATPEQNATAVWAAFIESGISATDVLRVMLSVLAGNTAITDLGGGNATVVFRDVNDTTDRVIATMEGSERTNITLNTN